MLYQLLIHGKSPGIAIVYAVIIKHGSEVLQYCILRLFNCMLAMWRTHYLEGMFVGLIVYVVYKSGDRYDMSTYRAITVCSVLAKLIMEQKMASWAARRRSQSKRTEAIHPPWQTCGQTGVL